MFNYFFRHNFLNAGYQIVKPINGNFKISSNTNTWIGAQIVFLGDYEFEIKQVFRKVIKPGDTILDVGANVGFHSLYFADLCGEKGQVISYEPILTTFKELIENIAINSFQNITVNNLALSDKAETLNVITDPKTDNPGAFNLFELGGDSIVNCVIGDEQPEIKNLDRLDFIKIDVEGYEFFVLNGLKKTINKFWPKIIFEYDINYQLKTGLSAQKIFELLKTFNYNFYLISGNKLMPLNDITSNFSGNILAERNDSIF